MKIDRTKSRIRYTIIVMLLITLSICSLAQSSHVNDNFVRDEITASKVAEAILSAVYGDEIQNQTPFNIKLVDDSVWVVRGRRHVNVNGIEIYRDTTINGIFYSLRGGVAEIKIRKSDCKILSVKHGK